MQPPDYLAKLDQLFSAFPVDGNELDYSNLDRHISYLKQLAVVENSSLMIFDLYRLKYVYCQSKYLPLLGITEEELQQKGPQGIFSIMHPDDLSFVLSTHFASSEFFFNLPAAEKKDYKSIYEFRLRCTDGIYRRFIQQMLPLECDAKGAIWLFLMVNDLLPDKNPADKLQRRMVNVKTGRLHLFNDEDELKSRTTLSKREIEILGLIGKGMASKEIAESLFLSVNTVNNHRRNILEKTNAKNTAEAVRYAISLGLM